MFKFKMQSILRYREWLEDEKKLLFAEKQRIYENEKARARALREMHLQYREALREETAKEEVSITMITFYHSYIFFLEKRMTEQAEVVAEAARVLAEAQQELIEAKKQKEIMVKLKDRALRVYKEEEARVEQIALDDFSTIKYIRTQRGLNQFSN
jgi:flagellar FliJ protein